MKDYLSKCLDLKDWHTPATDYPESQYGNFRIKRAYYRGHYYMYGIDGYLFFQAKKRLPVTTLQELRGKRWHTWMVDDPPHWRAMEIYAKHSEGNVLCAGLGLGLVMQAMKGNRNIKSLVVVENSENVVRLVEPQLPILPEFTIILDDFYHFIEIDYTQWDTIIVDLWVANEKTKMGIYYHEILPFAAYLRMKYPKAKLVFHGFSTVSDIKHTSPEMTKEVIEMMGYIGR